MNKILLFLFLSILLSCQSRSKHEIIEKWENGKNKIVFTYDNSNDTRTYLREYFHKNGILGSRGHYINAKQDGLWEWWYENGNKQDEAALKQGFYIGQRKHWYENGNLKQVEGYYKADKQDSIWYWYDPTGTVKTVQLYENGKFVKELK